MTLIVLFMELFDQRCFGSSLSRQVAATYFSSSIDVLYKFEINHQIIKVLYSCVGTILLLRLTSAK
jgi:hypothetical protein